MPLLTDEQLHAIRQIVADHHNAFVANYISPEALSPEVLGRLRELGLISTTSNTVEDAYVYGMVLAATQDPKVQNMGLDDFREYLSKNPMPLSDVERRAMQYAQHQAGQYAVGLGATYSTLAGQKIISAASKLEQDKMRGQIRDLTSEAIARRKSISQLKSDLGWATKDWTRDWNRIATTELNNAHQQGIADEYAGTYGPDVKVARRPNPDACHKCKELFLVGGVGPPRVFKLSDLIANGTNFKKKQADWVATATSVHPWCGCQTVRVPAGWGFDENWDLVPGGDREDYETQSDIRRALEQEDELRKAFKLQGHIDFQGIPIAIENKAGTVRKWKTPEGDEGQTRMEFAYGFAKRTTGDDGDDIDVYVGLDPRSQRVFVVNQLDPSTGRHDEVKAFLGFRNEQDAKLAYLAHVNKPSMFGGMLSMDIDAFKRYLGTTKPMPGHTLGETRLTIPIQKAQLKDRIVWSPRVSNEGVREFIGALQKAEARGGKYIRREPYTDKKGKRKYRYYYKESAAAREAKVGVEIRLGELTAKVLEVKPNGQIILSIGGKRQLVNPDQWHDMLHTHYGENFAKSAERRAQQAINAVLRHVPRKLLEDLKGDTDIERLQELETRVPEVYAKLQKAFKRAGMSPLQAKRSLSIILERRGWKPEARALVIGTVIKHRNIGTRELVVASESIARGKQVSAGHVATVVELRTPGGQPKAFTTVVAKVAQSAEAELANLSKSLAKAKRERDDAQSAAEALATALGSDGIQKLNLIAQAFPGLQDKAIDDVKKALEAVNDVSPSRPPTNLGGETIVYVSGEGGRPEPVAARYKLVEADTLVASHDPNTFARRPDYPEDVQERAYHRDKAEQAKVIRNAQKMDARFVVNTNPDAVNGPPMVMDDGTVLGGNSRTMSMQRIYSQHPDKAEEMRQYLKDHAHEVGLQKEDIEQFKNPVLIREVEVEDRSKRKLQLLVRQMNETFTQAMDPRTMQVAMGRRLTDDTLTALGNDMEDDDTLASFLTNKRSEPFVAALFRAGVIDNRNVNQYMKRGTRTLNDDGRTLVARILVGRTVDDADVLSNTGTQMMDSIARSVPFIAQAKTLGGAEYDIGGDLAVAIDAFNDLRSKVEAGSLRNLDPKMSDREVQKLLDNEFRSLFGDAHPVMGNDRAQVLLRVLIKKRGPVQMSKVFREFANIARANPVGQATMFGAPTTGLEALKQALGGEGEAPQGDLLAASMPLVMDLEKATPIGGLTPSGYRVSLVGGKRVYTKEGKAKPKREPVKEATQTFSSRMVHAANQDDLDGSFSGKIHDMESANKEILSRVASGTKPFGSIGHVESYSDHVKQLHKLAKKQKHLQVGPIESGNIEGSTTFTVSVRGTLGDHFDMDALAGVYGRNGLPEVAVAIRNAKGKTFKSYHGEGNWDIGEGSEDNPVQPWETGLILGFPVENTLKRVYGKRKIKKSEALKKADSKRTPVLQKALARRTTSHLPVSGQVSTEIGAQTSPAAFRAPGHGTFPNFLPGMPERTPVSINKDVIGYTPNPQTPEDIERRKVHLDLEDRAGYQSEVPIEPRTVEKPDMKLFIGLEGPMVHPGRDGLPIITSETSQQWHPRDEPGLTQTNRLETKGEYYDQAFSGDDVDAQRIREERPIDPEYADIIHERTDEDREREQAERERLEQNEKKGRMRPTNKVS